MTEDTTTHKEEQTMTDMMQRYDAVIKRLGHAALLDLPDEVKDVLKSTADLETKVKMLELIAERTAK